MAFRFHGADIAGCFKLQHQASSKVCLFLVTSIKIMDLGGQNLDRNNNKHPKGSCKVYTIFAFVSIKKENVSVNVIHFQKCFLVVKKIFQAKKRIGI